MSQSTVPRACLGNVPTYLRPVSGLATHLRVLGTGHVRRRRSLELSETVIAIPDKRTGQLLASLLSLAAHYTPRPCTSHSLRARCQCQGLCQAVSVQCSLAIIHFVPRQDSQPVAESNGERARVYDAKQRAAGLKEAPGGDRDPSAPQQASHQASRSTSSLVFRGASESPHAFPIIPPARARSSRSSRW
eukprot:3030253-Rhodomonas_salina.1